MAKQIKTDRAMQLASEWMLGQEQSVLQKLRALSGLEAVATGALIAIYLESDCVVEPVGNELARFNCELARELL